MQVHHDFSLIVSEWSTSRRLFNSQIESLRTRVENLRPETVVVMSIPRHHAKKLSQQDWTKDYYVSKETRSVTNTRTTTEVPAQISIVFSKYPTSSEQWFALAPEEPDTTIGFAHVVEICIPLNAWKPDHCPLSLLQEYQLTYDEVSTITIVVAPVVTKDLQQSFHSDNVRNSVVFVSNSESGIKIEPQLRLWKRISSQADVVALISTLGDTHSDGEENELKKSVKYQV